MVPTGIRALHGVLNTMAQVPAGPIALCGVDLCIGAQAAVGSIPVELAQG